MTSCRHRRTSAGILILVLFLGSAASVPLAADEAGLGPYRTLLEQSGFPENDETRRLLSDAVMAPAYPAVETRFKINRQLSDGRLVQFEIRKATRDWYLIFRNQRGEEPRETYPIWGRGTWIIKKSLLDGSYVQAKIFLQDDESSFVRLFPMADGRSRLDVHLYGRQLGDDVVIPVSFETLILSPFARLVALTDRSVPWEILFPDPEAAGYRRVSEMAATLGSYEELIREVPDGTINGAGINAYIETGLAVHPGAAVTGGGELQPGETGLNCSGYVKWVADGIYSGWAGTPGARHLEIADLRQPTSRVNRNSWSDSRSATGEDARMEMESQLRDPRFGLDWNRNLARLIEETRLGRPISPEETAVLDAGELKGIPYSRDLGYRLEDLPSALYQLSSGRPGAVWLVAVNSRFLPEPSPSDPDPLPLHQYWHVSIMAPWFDDGSAGGERGRFHVAVLDVGDVSESLLEDPYSDTAPLFPASIRANAIRYARLGSDDEGNQLIPEVMVHLVKVDIPGNFEPSPLPEAR